VYPTTSHLLFKDKYCRWSVVGMKRPFLLQSMLTGPCSRGARLIREIFMSVCSFESVSLPHLLFDRENNFRSFHMVLCQLECAFQAFHFSTDISPVAVLYLLTLVHLPAPQILSGYFSRIFSAFVWIKITACLCSFLKMLRLSCDLSNQQVISLIYMLV